MSNAYVFIDQDGNAIFNTISFVNSLVPGITLNALTTAQRNSLTNVNAGTLVFDLTLSAPFFYNGSAWVELNYTTLGTMAYQNANSVAIIGGTIAGATITAGSINNTPIGATTPSTGAFSTITASNLGTMSAENANAINITGGAINGTSVGATMPSTGAFTTISANNLGTLSSQNANNVAITGGTSSGLAITTGSVNNTPIGNSTPATGAFSTLNSGNAILTGGTINNVVIGGTTPAAGTFTSLMSYNISFNSTANPGLKLNNLTTAQQNLLTATQGNLIANTTTARPNYYNGSTWNQLVYSTDLGTVASQNVNAINLTGGIINGITIGATTSAPGTFSALNSSNVTFTGGTSTGLTITTGSINNTPIGATIPSTGVFTTINANNLGTISSQNANNVTITGGTLDNVTIGGTTPAAGTFTTLVSHSNSYNSNNAAGLTLNNLTTTQRTALTGVNGNLVADTTVARPFYYNTNWNELAFITDIPARPFGLVYQITTNTTAASTSGTTITNLQSGSIPANILTTSGNRALLIGQFSRASGGALLGMVATISCTLNNVALPVLTLALPAGGFFSGVAEYGIVYLTSTTAFVYGIVNGTMQTGAQASVSGLNFSNVQTIQWQGTVTDNTTNLIQNISFIHYELNTNT